MAQAQHQEKSDGQREKKTQQPLFLKLGSVPPAKKP
jgi:hypothetical protein